MPLIQEIDLPFEAVVYLNGDIAVTLQGGTPDVCRVKVKSWLIRTNPVWVTTVLLPDNVTRVPAGHEFVKLARMRLPEVSSFGARLARFDGFSTYAEAAECFARFAVVSQRVEICTPVLLCCPE